jgi:hypothetical protein
MEDVSQYRLPMASPMFVLRADKNNALDVAMFDTRAAATDWPTEEKGRASGSIVR